MHLVVDVKECKCGQPNCVACKHCPCLKGQYWRPKGFLAGGHWDDTYKCCKCYVEFRDGKEVIRDVEATNER